MDNIILNEDRLWQLRNFIIKRGIKEADVVNEILDHFACKVEEILSAEKNMPLERAMQLAHQSFGASGFRPLVAEYEKHVEQTLNSLFKQELKKVLSSPKIIYLLFFGLLTIPCLNILEPKLANHWLFDIEFIGLLFMVLVSGLTSVMTIKKHKAILKEMDEQKDASYLWQKQSLIKPSMPVFIILSVIPFVRELLDSKLATIAIAVFMVLVMIKVLAQYQTYLAMEKRFGISHKN